MREKYKHLTWNDRLTIERMVLNKFKVSDIAKAIGCCRATVYNELKRATYVHTNDDLTEEVRYNPDAVQKKYEENLKKKGHGLKAAHDRKLLKYIEEAITEDKYSPAAALMKIKQQRIPFSVEIKSVNTVYSYIRKGIFDSLSMEDLPTKKRKHKKKKVKRQKRANQGVSIESRPKEIDSREEFGHWEMDTVVGKVGNQKSILVLTERKTRHEILEVLHHHTAAGVVRAINRLEREIGSNFYRIFKTITVDNGSEFADAEGLAKALRRVGKRTDIYYCHPYRSCERASNENQNRFIRRWYPKGSDFDKILTKKGLKKTESWINVYPRRLFDGRCSESLFKEECAKLGITI